MATSLRNLIGGSIGGPKGLNPYESAAVGCRGLTNTQPLGALRGLEYLIPHWHLFDANKWKQTLVSVGATSSTVITAASATLPQHLVITTGSTNGDGVNLQYALANDFSALTTYNVVTPFVAKAGFNINMKMRILMDEATSVGFLAGLADSDTTLLGSGVHSNTDFIGFYKPTATTTILGVCRTSSTSTNTANLQTVAVSTWYDLEMKISGRAGVEFWVGGTKVTQGTLTNLPANTVPLTLSMAFQTMSSAVQVLKVQNFTCSQEAI